MKTRKNRTLTIVIIIILSITLIGFGGYFYLLNSLKSAISGCELQTKQFTETINFEYVDNWIVIKVKIEGSDKEYPFFFDTGSATVISDSLLKDLNKKEYNLFSSNDKKDTSNAFHNKLYVMNGLSIGNIKFKKIGAMSVDNRKWEMLNCVSAYGIIGYNILQTCCFQINYMNKTITITDQPEQLPNYNKIKWITYKTDKQETPVLTATLNDSLNVDLFFDTGLNGGIVLNSPKLYEQFEKFEHDRIAKMTSIPTMYIRGEKLVPYKSLRYKTTKLLLLGSESSGEIVISVNKLPEKNFTGSVGNQYLKNYNITLDYQNKRIGYTHQEHLSSFEKNTYGFNYFPRNNKLFIGSVYENSEAERSGICAGEEIVSINGIMISKLPEEVFYKIYRNEYSFSNMNDTLLKLKVKRDSGIAEVQLRAYPLFN